MHTIEDIQSYFTNYLSKNRFSKEPFGLYEPVDYIMKLGGKRLRPALVLMAYDLYKNNIEQALPAAFAVEVFHSFSLLHDDIMDDATIRRGKPAVHVKFSTNAGILSGDVMLVYAYQYLLKSTSEENAKEIVAVFNKFAIEVCEGQQMDMDFESRNDVSIDEYLKMIELKTSVLIAGGLKIGAILGGANESDVENLYQFGRNVGLAFQMQDDILDTFGDIKFFGKKIGGDIAQNKKTFLYLKAIELSNTSQKQALIDLYNNNEIAEVLKIEKVTAMFNSLKTKNFAEEKMQNYLSKAFNHLEKVQVEVSKKNHLRKLAEELMKRKV